MEETFVILNRYKELSKQHSTYDLYRPFSLSGGRLCYDTFKQVEAARATDLVCHFARTPLRECKMAEEINVPCIRILPLDLVSVSF